MLTDRIASSLLMAVVFCGVAPAATFTANGGGASGTSSIIDAGGGGDYLTLAAAAADFNSFVGGAAADYTFFINSDLTEPANIAIGNATNGRTITFRPMGSARVVTMSQITDNAASSGHIVIGVTDLTTTPVWALVSTNNVVFDGSLTVGGTTRDLTITDTSASIPNDYIFRVVGNSDGVQFKNLILTNLTTAATSSYGVLYASRNQSATDFVPDNGLVRNCAITVTGGAAGQGIGASNSGTITAGTAQTGLVLEDNTITARTRGVFLNQSAGGTVRRNNIVINQTSSGFTSYGIWLLSDNSTTGYTLDVYNNVLSGLTTANTVTAQGIIGIEFNSASSAGAARTINCYNNLLYGYSIPAGTAVDAFYRGIRVSSTNAVVKIEHNSIHMPDFPIVNNTTALNATGISSTGTLLATGSVTVRNNAIHYQDNGGNAIYFATAGAGSVASTGNNIYVTGTANTGRFSTTTYATLANWQGAGYDLPASGAQAVDFFTTTPSNWGPTLHWTGTGKPTGVTSTASSTVLADVEGDSRSSGLAYAGADEFLAFALPVELTTFVLD